MEDIKQLLDQNESCLVTNSEEDDECSESSFMHLKCNNNDICYENHRLFEMKYPKPIDKRKRNGEKRLPTRRPDPNIYNRNALLARENRRKKKVYLETIENELVVARKANWALAKALKRQFKITQRLEKEKKYFESLVTEQGKIIKYDSTLSSLDECDASPLSAYRSNDGYIHIEGETERATTRSVCSDLQDDALSIRLDTPSDGTVTTPMDSSFCDFSTYDFSLFPEFFADLDSCCSGNSLSLVCSDADFNIDNLISSNSTILQNNIAMPNFLDDHCYVSKFKNNNVGNLKGANSE